MTPSAEQALLAKARRGDQQALGELLIAYQDRLYNVCLRMVSHPDDAAEVCQDVLMKVVQSIGRFRGESGLATWMTRIAMNQSISHLRKRRVRRAASLDQPVGRENDIDDQASALRHQLADTREPAPEQRVQEEEMLARLQQAMANLDDDFRAVLVLRDIEQLDYAQISQTLDIPTGTVKSRLFRARLALRQEMDRVCTVGGQAGLAGGGSGHYSGSETSGGGDV
ncbi:MAG: sigma-70 family RNA polymerase sigma factor [Phycisphaerales bacterium]